MCLAVPGMILEVEDHAIYTLVSFIVARADILDAVVRDSFAPTAGDGCIISEGFRRPRCDTYTLCSLTCTEKATPYLFDAVT